MRGNFILEFPPREGLRYGNVAAADIVIDGANILPDDLHCFVVLYSARKQETCMILLYPPTAFGKIDFLNETYDIAVPII